METFTRSELQAMQVLWKHGTLKPSEIVERFPRPIKNAALRSLLLLLLERGHVARKKIGRAYYYRAVTPPESELKKITRRLAKVFGNGSPKALIAELIKSEELTDEDIQDLRRIARSDKEKSDAE